MTWAGSFRAAMTGGIASVAAGCAALVAPVTTQPPVSPLLYDAAVLAQRDKVAVFVPGAFASVDIFEAAAFWANEGYALAYYRFPGRDGLAEDHALDIDVAGGIVAGFLRAHPAHDAVLVGYSTGGPIVLTAARAFVDTPRRGALAVALISPAVDRAGGIETRLRGFSDVVAAALRARSLRADDVWRAYWQVLLFGRDNVDDPAFADRIAELVEEEHALLTPPTRAIAALHTRALSRWRLPSDFTLGDIPVGLFLGRADPVFSWTQSTALARRLGLREIVAYDTDGHMPFLTQERLFHDVLAFAENAR